MIGKFKDPSIWGPHLAVAAAYAACYEVVRYFSFPHWMITAGLRLGCLLLVPRRFWPALVIGEFLPIAEKVLLGSPPFGAAWALIAAIPPILLCAPVIAFLHKHMALMREGDRANMIMILTSALVIAVITAGVNTAAVSVVVMPDGSPPPVITMQPVLAVVLGNYLGALTITPTVLALRERIMRIGGPLALHHVTRSPLLREILCVEGPVIVALLSAVHFIGGDTTVYFRMSMVIPVIVLAWRHGWHGASIGGMLASIALAESAIAVRDPSMIPVQALLALIISTSLLLGARVRGRLAAGAPASSRINALPR